MLGPATADASGAELECDSDRVCAAVARVDLDLEPYAARGLVGTGAEVTVFSPDPLNADFSGSAKLPSSISLSLASRRRSASCRFIGSGIVSGASLNLIRDFLRGG